MAGTPGPSRRELTIFRVDRNSTLSPIDCHNKTTREINREIRLLIAKGEQEIVVRNPEARHNLGVAVLEPAKLIFEGSVGYYCAGLIDGPTVEIRGSAGWGVGESMMGGTVVVERNAGNSAGASIRGGTVVIRGSASARAGIAMKGGTLIIEGNSGYMTGFMMQRGMIIVCGDTGEALGDSMYEGAVFVGGKITDLGNDAVVSEPSQEDQALLISTLTEHGITAPSEFKKIVAGKRLWTFDKKDFEAWREAL